jgi:hypothetical protein
MYEDAKAEYVNDFVPSFFYHLYSKFKVPNSDLERKKAEFDALGNRLKTKENELTKKSMELQHQKSGLFFKTLFLFSVYLDLHLAESRSQEIMEAKLKNIARLARNTSILDAWKFYENNRNLFRFPVYVPFLHSNLFELFFNSFYLIFSSRSKSK